MIIGAPLDGTKNPATAVGTGFSDITGVVLFQWVSPAYSPVCTLKILLSRFGFYYVLPLTAPTVISVPDPVIPPSTIVSDVSDVSDACAITFGDYNVGFILALNP